MATDTLPNPNPSSNPSPKSAETGPAQPGAEAPVVQRPLTEAEQQRILDRGEQAMNRIAAGLQPMAAALDQGGQFVTVAGAWAIRHRETGEILWQEEPRSKRLAGTAQTVARSTRRGSAARG